MVLVVILLAVLCIAMSCVALWYRGKWQGAKKSYANMSDLYYEMKEKYNDERDERERISCSLGYLNIEVDATKEKLRKKCKNNLDIRKSVCIFASRKVISKAVRQ